VREQDAAGDAGSDPVSLARAALAAARAASKGAAHGARNGPGKGPGSVAGHASQTPSELALGSDADAGPVQGAAVQGARTGSDRSSGLGRRTGSGAGASTGRAARARGPAPRPGFAVQPPATDPQPLAEAIGGLLDDEGWTLAAATGSVFGRWAQIVGRDLAAHTTPEKLTDGELTVAADSTAWATQLRLLSGQLIKRLNAELGDGSVLRVRVVGPVTSARQPGQWRVRGSRGPRDTYG
jgi:predicted nucleic acid-binding Zn ribbon protein